MFTMDQVHTIRDLFYNQGLNMAEIAEKLGCDWRTVKKYVDREDFSPPTPIPESEVKHESKLDPFKPLIDQWLSDDKKAPRKQRHTAKRVFSRLREEASGFECSYRLVADYVSGKKKSLKVAETETEIPILDKRVPR